MAIADQRYARRSSSGFSPRDVRGVPVPKSDLPARKTPWSPRFFFLVFMFLASMVIQWYVMPQWDLEKPQRDKITIVILMVSEIGDW
jgi:hypothetical protein